MTDSDSEAAAPDKQHQSPNLDNDRQEETEITEEVKEEVEIPEFPTEINTQVRTEEVEEQAANNIQALTDEINSLRTRVSALDHQLANADQENARLETQHANISASFAQLQRELAELEASSKFIAAAKDAVDRELAEEKIKRETAEETVEVLRGKVDDARKAIGKLQQQDKRASVMLTGMEAPGVDALGMGSLDDGVLIKPRSNKRASILFGANVTSKTNRRLSSASDHESSSNMLLSPPSINAMATPSLPQAPVNSKGLRELRLSSAGGGGLTPSPGMPPSPGAITVTGALLEPYKEVSNKRWSGLGFGSAPRGSPTRPPVDIQDNTLEEDDPVEELGALKQQGRPALGGKSVSSSSFTSTGAGAFDATVVPAKQQPGEEQLLALQAEVLSLRLKLEDSQEARVASEDCLKALREFIASSHSQTTPQAAGDQSAISGETGFAGIKLPPLPTDRDPEDEYGTAQRQPSPEKKGGWGLGLWRSAAPSMTNQSLTTSTRSEAGDLRSVASTAPSPFMENDKQLAELQIDDQETHMPLKNFVSSWSKGVSVGVAKLETPPSAIVAPSPAKEKKGFSFFTRSNSDMGAAGDTTPTAATNRMNQNDGKNGQPAKDT
ncbi:hypothetical protein QFC21_001309 [Naganishia friedmannii]|uniref:Uncharacterized protein n=1 Tax=Naganishia friedmannii TaxID=89922 RepID=A0ACC2W5P0_9TREE|nr:hypothetical protein QFC21_001309 [Naganishia friedmannii]